MGVAPPLGRLVLAFRAPSISGLQTHFNSPLDVYVSYREKYKTDGTAKEALAAISLLFIDC